MFIRSAELFRPKRTAASWRLLFLRWHVFRSRSDLACADGYPSKFSFGETATEAGHCENRHRHSGGWKGFATR